MPWCGGCTGSSTQRGRPSEADETSLTVAFTYHGLQALGVPQASLDSFAPEFREGMAARAEILGDTGESGPDHWEQPLGTTDVHVAIAVLSSDESRLREVAEKAREAHAELPGIELIWRQDCYQLATGRTSFGFKDGIGQPAVEGSGRPSTNPRERPLKAGEIILGYPDETGELPPMPTPDVLGRNGTYVVFRKLHTRVAAYRQLPAREGGEPGGGGPPRREDGRPLAERRPPRARARPGRPRARERPASATTTSASATTPAASSARSAPTRAGRTPATRSTRKAAWTSGCTG